MPATPTPRREPRHEIHRHPAGRLVALGLAAWALALLAGCATPRPDAVPPPAPAAAWQAPLPHGGETGALVDWWSRFDDPLLPALIADAQATSPTLAQALARVAQGRAALRVADAGRWPSVDGTVGASRASNAGTSFVPASQASATADASWELDLFGGRGHGIDAARARADSAVLGWHDARVSLAADVALGYLGLRGCEALLEVYRQSEASQARTAELTRQKLEVGFESPANAALADATSARARDRRVAQQAQCDIGVKGLVLLTGSDEASLRHRLAGRRARLPHADGFALEAVPAAVLAQRPDIAAGERELLAAAADVGVAEADRYPRLTLAGGIGAGVVRLGGETQDAVTWSFGPSLVLPLFDAGRRRAQRDAALARYDEARAALEQRLRGAVREVEEALVRVAAAQDRLDDAERAARGFREYFDAAESSWRAGAGSLIDMEDARRLALDAQATLVGVQLEREDAWVGLYRAAGGGWTADDRLPEVAAGLSPLPASRPPSQAAPETVRASAQAFAPDATPQATQEATATSARAPLSDAPAAPTSR